MDLFFSQLDSISKHTLFKSSLPSINIKEVYIARSMLNFHIGDTWKIDEIKVVQYIIKQNKM